MAYEKQTWQTGEVITQEKLNHMEDGIGSCVMVVGMTTEGQTTTLDKTWQEIHDAMVSGKVVVLMETTGLSSYCELVIGCIVDAEVDDYSVKTTHYDGELGTLTLFSFSASSADGYPSYTRLN